VRLDVDPQNQPDIVCDAANMREKVTDGSFDTVLCDPPYNGKFQWNHDLLSELARVASRRIIFQHWFLPANKDGGYKKAHDKWKLSALYVWQPRTYFGRVQLVSVFDAVGVA
jgi:16S rRNA G966 N2-methylase RsmD